MDPWPMIYKGVKNQDYNIYTIQYLLRVAGYDVRADGSFGPKTENTVKQFQKSVGLDPDGKVGEYTWRKMIDGQAFKCYPKKGDPPGDCIKAAQSELVKNGYLHGQVKAIDGIFGTNTDDALTHFQEERMPPPPSHKVDEKTWENLIRNSNPG